MTGPLLLMIALFGGLLAALEVGRVIGRRRRAQGAEGDQGSEPGTAAAEGVVFALLGLLVAFTFTHSAARFDRRRELIIRQANAFGTAWLRLDTLAPDRRERIRAPMRRWLDIAGNVSAYTADERRLREALAEADRAQQEAWRQAVAALDERGEPPLKGFVLAPFNDWIDLTTERVTMDDLGLPPMVLPTLAVLALLAALLTGFEFARRRSPLHAVVFAGAVTFSIYIILDLNEPRSGLIRVDATDRVMRDLRASLAGNADAPAP
jgi:hypothetical protein